MRKRKTIGTNPLDAVISQTYSAVQAAGHSTTTDEPATPSTEPVATEPVAAETRVPAAGRSRAKSGAADIAAKVGGATADIDGAEGVAQADGQNAEPPRRPTKQRLTVHLPVELIERAKNAVYWSPGLTLTALAEDAFGDALSRLEAAHGKPFAPRLEELRGGRPMK